MKLFFILFSTAMLSVQPVILFKNCTVYGRPNADRIYVQNGTILSVGKSDVTKPDSVVDLQGGFVYPGFTDAHLHLAGLGESLEQLNLVGTESPEAILRILDEFDRKDQPWIKGRGWDQNDWETKRFPNRQMLDSIVDDVPVFFRRIDGHAVWVNSKALEIAGITKDTPNPKGGRIIKSENGEPSGILIDNAVDLITPHIPKNKIDDKKRHILKAQEFLLSLGITALHEPGVGPSVVEALRQLRDEGLLTIRVYAMLDDNWELVKPFLEAGPEGDGVLQFKSVKIYFDGALGSRGAALLEPYSDDLGNMGLLLTHPDSVMKKVQELNAAGFQANIHCIGDRANRAALDIFESVGHADMRNRIEHAQIIHPEDIPRFSKLGVIPSMQPTHCTSDMPWAESRLGPNRTKGAYAWQALIRAGSMIPAGSDAPVEHPDPLAGIYAAVTRQDQSGNPEAGWIPQERMTMHQAISSFTEWPAFASFNENIQGEISSGYFADFTVLSKSLDTLSGLEILKTDVMFTVVNGTIVYQQQQQGK